MQELWLVTTFLVQLNTLSDKVWEIVQRLDHLLHPECCQLVLLGSDNSDWIHHISDSEQGGGTQWHSAERSCPLCQPQYSPEGSLYVLLAHQMTAGTQEGGSHTDSTEYSGRWCFCIIVYCIFHNQVGLGRIEYQYWIPVGRQWFQSMIKAMAS